jgi:hypothetical protein
VRQAHFARQEAIVLLGIDEGNKLARQVIIRKMSRTTKAAPNSIHHDCNQNRVQNGKSHSASDLVLGNKK